MAQGPGTPPGSQYGITGNDWLQALARGIMGASVGLAGVYRPRRAGTFAELEELQRQQWNANRAAGYAVAKPAQALMDWVKKWLTEQEKARMNAVKETPEERPVP